MSESNWGTEIEPDPRYLEDQDEGLREWGDGAWADGWVVAGGDGELDPEDERMLEDWSGWKPQASDNDKISSKEN